MDSDCDGFCEYCVDGECYDAIGCCGLAPDPRGELELRCQGYDCYADDECDDGELCAGSPGWCEPILGIPLCERQPLQLSAIPLQGPATALALADLDGDAALDLVAVLAEQGEVEVMLGDGAGGFSPGVTFPTELEAGAQRVAIADFDGDGSADLAVLRALPVGELALLFGQDAVFAAPVKETLGESPVQVWSGDFDGDGRPDLLARSELTAVPLTLRLGDGLGGFGPELHAPPIEGSGLAAAIGQLDGDPARPDVALAIEDSGVRVDIVELAPNLVLAPLSTVTADGEATLADVAVGDVDGDGVAEIIGRRAPPLFDLLRIWSGKQRRPELRVDVPLQLGPVADVDGDGAGDLVAATADGIGVVFVHGGVSACLQQYALAGATEAPLLAAGDVDGDGKVDVIAGLSGQASAALLRSGP